MHPDLNELPAWTDHYFLRTKQIAQKFQSAEDVLDEDPSSWTGFAPPDKPELVRLRKKLFILVGSMDEAFPAGR